MPWTSPWWCYRQFQVQLLKGKSKHWGTEVAMSLIALEQYPLLLGFVCSIWQHSDKGKKSKCRRLTKESRERLSKQRNGSLVPSSFYLYLNLRYSLVFMLLSAWLELKYIMLRLCLLCQRQDFINHQRTIKCCWVQWGPNILSSLLNLATV